ncbi:WhiB family transcriptional regulator [Mycolicibacterium sp. CBMA 226]|uniref:WhiB family transcriptional regulator n=1 Tax=Mycolicibacterium sp. CBMA 226 TaxID=2606611 RepID=UPI0012DCD9BF|nr:WhiB family transcriptional regulator [Mycolicibacterium sp. CBMA 226]MUL77130.1 WhiB family transcriptional regulator [Mycolicibacterium sp. CBMA 226]
MNAENIRRLNISSPGANEVAVHEISADWRYAARCRTEDPDLFFHPEGERTARRRRRLRRAHAVCAECTVARQCATYAVAFREGFGIWGGMSEDELVARIVADGGRPRGRAVHVTRFATAISEIENSESM